MSRCHDCELEADQAAYERWLDSLADRIHIMRICEEHGQNAGAFCHECGKATTAIVCVKCDTELWVGDKYCFVCGHPTPAQVEVLKQSIREADAIQQAEAIQQALREDLAS